MAGTIWKNILKKIAGTGLGIRVRSFFARDYFQSHIVLWLLALSFVANLTDWIILAIFIKPVDFPIILHYNVYFGVDMLGDWRQIFMLPIVGVILLTANVFLSMHFYENKERIASYLLLMATLMIQLSLLIAATSAIVINY